MFFASLIFFIFGGFLAFISLNAIATRKPTDEISSEEILDVLVFNGMIALFRDLRNAISKALKDRTQPEFASLVVLIWGIVLLAVGGLLFYWAPEGVESGKMPFQNPSLIQPQTLEHPPQNGDRSSGEKPSVSLIDPIQVQKRGFSL